MKYLKNVIMVLLVLVCYLVGYLIFSNPLGSSAMVLCFWAGAIMSVILED